MSYSGPTAAAAGRAFATAGTLKTSIGVRGAFNRPRAHFTLPVVCEPGSEKVD